MEELYYEKLMDKYLSNLNNGVRNIDGFSDYDQQHEQRIIFHLRDEGFIAQNSVEITIRGRIFINSGGYIAKHKRTIYEQSLIPKMAKWQKRLSVWAMILGIATIALVLVEVFAEICQ